VTFSELCALISEWVSEIDRQRSVASPDFLNAMQTEQNASSVSLSLSLSLSVRKLRLENRRTDFHGVGQWSVLLKLAGMEQFWLRSNVSNGYTTALGEDGRRFLLASRVQAAQYLSLYTFYARWMFPQRRVDVPEPLHWTCTGCFKKRFTTLIACIHLLFSTVIMYQNAPSFIWDGHSLENWEYGLRDPLCWPHNTSIRKSWH
jgi:hypothetical protein